MTNVGIGSESKPVATARLLLVRAGLAGRKEELAVSTSRGDVLKAVTTSSR